MVGKKGGNWDVDVEGKIKKVSGSCHTNRNTRDDWGSIQEGAAPLDRYQNTQGVGREKPGGEEKRGAWSPLITDKIRRGAHLLDGRGPFYGRSKIKRKKKPKTAF